MKRILVGYRNPYGISLTGRSILIESGFDVSEDSEIFGIIVDADENDESVDEMLEAMVKTKAKDDSQFKIFISRCERGKWAI